MRNTISEREEMASDRLAALNTDCCEPGISSDLLAANKRNALQKKLKLEPIDLVLSGPSLASLICAQACVKSIRVLPHALNNASTLILLSRATKDTADKAPVKNSLACVKPLAVLFSAAIDALPTLFKSLRSFNSPTSEWLMRPASMTLFKIDSRPFSDDTFLGALVESAEEASL